MLNIGPVYGIGSSSRCPGRVGSAQGYRMSLRQDHRGNGQVGGMRLADGWIRHLKGEQQRPYSPPQDLTALCALPQACTFVWAEESRLVSASYSIFYAVSSPLCTATRSLELVPNPTLMSFSNSKRPLSLKGLE